jgi:hypothetical protein
VATEPTDAVVTPLPPSNAAWPPSHVAKAYARMPRLLAWYGGDVDALGSSYGSVVAAPVEVERQSGGNWLTRGVRQLRGEFWGGSTTEVQEHRHHAPIAEEIAKTHANLVMGDAPRFIVEGPLYDADATELDTDGEPIYRKGDPKPETAAAQRRLDWLLNACDGVATILASVEIGSMLGWYGLRVAVEPDKLGERAVIARVDATHTVPEYSWGQFVAVTFWRIVAKDDKATYRHLERHEHGTVYHGLYRSGGSGEEGLGQKVPLTDRPETADLEPIVILSQKGLTTGISVPNALPDPLDLQNNAGRSALTPAVQDLMSNADEFLTLLMDSVDDAKSRLVIADYLMQSNGRGQSLNWDKDTRFMRRVNTPPGGDDAGRLPIEQIQFDMRVAEYLMGFEKMRELAIYAAGYNSQTFGEEGTVPQTATEYAGKNKRSMSTREAAIGYLHPKLEALLTALLDTDVQEFHPKVDGDAFDQGEAIQAFPVRVVFPEAVQPTFSELADDATKVKATGGTQLEVVKVLYPDYTEAKQRTMAQARLDEVAAATPDTFGPARPTEEETANDPADPLAKPGSPADAPAEPLA